MLEFEFITQGLNIRPKKGVFGYSSIILFKDGDENILFDTGGYGARGVLIDLLEKMRIHKVFLSHLHFDHCSNADLFTESAVYLHKNELDFLFSEKSKTDFDLFQPFKNYSEKLNIQTIEGVEQISKNLKSIETCGHTIGHSSLWFEENGKKYIATGDALKTYNDLITPGYTGNAFNQTLASISKAKIVEEFDYFIPGHYGLIDKMIISNPQRLELSFF